MFILAALSCLRDFNKENHVKLGGKNRRSYGGIGGEGFEDVFDNTLCTCMQFSIKINKDKFCQNKVVLKYPWKQQVCCAQIKQAGMSGKTVVKFST
jgi:hypothetical protein